VNCLTEVVDLFAKLLKRPMTPIWYMCAYKPIFQLLQHVPGLDSKTEATIAARVVELEDEDA
jgi:hypothetical protein